MKTEENLLITNENIKINDKRIVNDFKNISFSNFKKNDVKKQLIKSVINNKIEDTMYWVTELVCACHFLDIWEIIFEITSKHIYIANPKLPIYIKTKTDIFKNILIKLNDELYLRNNQKIRDIFCELFAILCYSTKKQKYDYIKIDKNEFNISELSYRLKADNLYYAKQCFKKEDPTELFIAINEFCYNLSNKCKNTLEACYWIEWILQYELTCKKNKENCICSTREFDTIVKIRDNNDVIWLIWECILFYSKNINPVVYKSTCSILSLFNLHYSSSVKRKRKHLIYLSIYLITEEYNIKTPICGNTQSINNIVNNINNIYKALKKNEVAPTLVEKQNYLFANIM
jgi:hypothetical protein